jgi:hypothetical protein
VLASLPLDAVADQFAVQNWMHERLPPLAAPDDARRLPHAPVGIDARVRMRSRSVARLAVEGELAVLYHHASNTRVYREVRRPWPRAVEPTSPVRCRAGGNGWSKAWHASNSVAARTLSAPLAVGTRGSRGKSRLWHAVMTLGRIGFPLTRAMA